MPDHVRHDKEWCISKGKTKVPLFPREGLRVSFDVDANYCLFIDPPHKAGAA
jgi:hypothetical protein